MIKMRKRSNPMFSHEQMWQSGTICESAYVELQEDHEDLGTGWDVLYSEPLTLEAEETEAMAGRIGRRGDLEGEPLMVGGWRLVRQIIEIVGVICDFEEPSLHQKIPYSAGFIDIDFDQVTGLSPTKFSSPASVFPDKCFFDDEIRFRENSKLRAECLLCRC